MYTQTLWTWIDVGSFRPQIAFYLDALSLVMMLVVTFVSFLIHLYSTEFMRADEGYSRFFAYMNLFVASMVTLLLADNLLLLYLGWEGVGLCSYLLIGFWYQDPVNGRAARKAFIVTRVGDTAMTIGLFLLFHSLGTLRIQDLMHAAQASWPPVRRLRLPRRRCCWVARSANPRNCRCKPGCRMPWPAQRPPAPSSTRPPW